MTQGVEPSDRAVETVTTVVNGARRRGVAVFVVAAALLLTSTVWVAMRSGAEEQSGVLVRNGDGSISLLDAETGTTVFNLDDAFPTPNLSSLLTTRPWGQNTVLQSRDARTGEVTGSTELDGQLHVRSISPSGGAVVLMPGRRGAGLYEPQPRTSTEITVAYLDDRPARQFTLDGNLEPEMLSLDESTLFVLDFVPPTAPTNYYVRKVDLATGAVTDTDSIQVDLTSKMAGRARAQVMHPDGTFLYTVYTLPWDRPIHDIAVSEDAERFAFVHVISLEDKWSHCVFLPIPFGTTDEATLGMAVSPDGTRVLVADPAIGRIAELDTGSLTVSAVHPVPQLRDTGARAVVAIATDGTVFASSGNVVLELSPDDFQVVSAWGGPGVVTGLSVSDSVLRVASGGVVTLLDRASGTETGVIRGSGRGTVDLLGPPQGNVVEFPLECAC